jgi:hypothetical protein
LNRQNPVGRSIPTGHYPYLSQRLSDAIRFSICDGIDLPEVVLIVLVYTTNVLVSNRSNEHGKKHPHHYDTTTQTYAPLR